MAVKVRQGGQWVEVSTGGQGPAGPPGPPGQSGSADFGFYIVKHSQSTTVKHLLI